MRFSYPCVVVQDDEEANATGREAYCATFPDVPPAITGGGSVQEVNDNLRDCLETALSIYLDEGKPLPEPSEPEPGQVLVAVSPPVAAQFALYEALRAQGVSAIELARRIGLRASNAKRLIDIFRPAKPDEIDRALAAVGLQMTSEVVPLGQWMPSHKPAPAL
ncbi:type II toxin-antitoxin system HicB family antitoxin [Candidatus Poriferisodalis sp.]|uniref:type II toxin-antitoxin system HicB family antitoxin n=1 Tax=Candidatus Poriferisodalis sp. TaxID=3101277 RepID=UPI003B01CA19